MFPGFFVNVRRRLVGDDDFRTVHQRPGNGYALLLSAAEFFRCVGKPVAESHFFQEGLCRFITVSGRYAERHERIRDVFPTGEVGDEVKVLKDKADLFHAGGLKALCLKTG